MLKLCLAFMMSLTLIHAEDELPDVCFNDMSQMLSSYYKAKKDKLEDNKKLATKGFEQSINSAYKALESCKDTKTYDFNIMYSFIQASERELYE